MRKTMIGLAALALAALTTPAAAENSTEVDGYTIHHNAITTDMLTPEISRAYRIPRSRNRGMLNVSVIKDVGDSSGQPVAAGVTAVSINYLGQQRPIRMREIREGDAVYYIGDFLVQHGELLSFDIEVRPEGEKQVFSTRMSQEFFTRP